MKIIYCYDAYETWAPSLWVACHKKGWEFRQLRFGSKLPEDGWLFVRLNMHPGRLADEKDWLAPQMERPGLHWVTDVRQILHYEDKVSQAALLQHVLPPTDIYYDLSEVNWRGGYPCISKAAVGASSQFVRLIPNREELMREAKMIFSPQGYPLNTKKWKSQQGYMYVQKFLPGNDYTWRVNIVGDQAAVWKRFNYDDRPMAETGRTTPIDPRACPDVVEFAREVAFDIGSKWVALDILTHEGEFYCLETSLGWPWPGVGGGRFTNGKRWEEMWHVLLDEIEAGAFPA